MSGILYWPFLPGTILVIMIEYSAMFLGNFPVFGGPFRESARLKINGVGTMCNFGSYEYKEGRG
jgi:hypothetical protein